MPTVNASSFTGFMQVTSSATIESSLAPNQQTAFNFRWVSNNGQSVSLIGSPNSAGTALETITTVIIGDGIPATIVSITGLDVAASDIIPSYGQPDFAETFWAEVLAGETTVLTPVNLLSGLFTMAGDFSFVLSGDAVFGANDLFTGGGARFSGFLSGDAVEVASAATLTGGDDTFVNTITDALFGDVGSMVADIVNITSGTILGGDDQIILSRPPGSAGITMQAVFGDVGSTATDSVVFGGADTITLIDVASVTTISGDGNLVGGTFTGGADSISIGSSSPFQPVGIIGRIVGDGTIVESRGGAVVTGGDDTIDVANVIVTTVSGDFDSASQFETFEFHGGDDSIILRWEWYDDLPPNARPAAGAINGDAREAVNGNRTEFYGGNDTISLFDMAATRIAGDVSDYSDNVYGVYQGGNDSIIIDSSNPLINLPTAVSGDSFDVNASEITFGNDQILVTTAILGPGSQLGITLYGDSQFVTNFELTLPVTTFGDDLIRLVTNSGSTVAATLIGDAFDLASDGRDLSVIDLGDDTLIGGNGNDTLIGDYSTLSLGGDFVFQGGDDVLDGGLGNDTLNGGVGDNTADFSQYDIAVTVMLEGLPGESYHAIGQGQDFLVAIQNVRGSQGNDMIVGDTVANRLDGQFGADRLFGGNGNDTLIGGAGADTMNGGADVDTADYSASNARVVVRLWNGTGQSGHAQGDSLTDIENLVGSGFNDVLIGRDAVANRLDGGVGDDYLDGRRCQRGYGGLFGVNRAGGGPVVEWHRAVGPCGWRHPDRYRKSDRVILQ